MKQNELIKKIQNEDLKLTVAEAPENIKKDDKWVVNPFFNALSSQIGRTEMKLEELNEKGLFYKNKDVYVYLGRGGIKVEETPKGIRKMLVYLSEKYERRIIISDGVLYPNDSVSISTDGLIDVVNIVRDSQSLLSGQMPILAPYAVISILSKNDDVLTKKFIVMPNNELVKAMDQAGNVKHSYPTMMATKMVMKRALTQVYSLLGTGMENDDSEMLDNAIENSNVNEVIKIEEKEIDQQDTLANDGKEFETVSLDEL